jgi:hypothetical protein
MGQQRSRMEAGGSVQLVSLLCVAAYCVVATMVAIRMLRLAARTGELPELLIGCALLLGGAIGFPSTAMAPLLGASQPDLGLRLGLSGTLGLHLSCFANVLAWYVIFHAGSHRARLAAVACTVALFLSLVERSAGSMLLLQAAGGGSYSRSYYASLVVQSAPYLLMAVSGFRYHGRLTRRLAIGLADPVVTNRIWLWSATSAVVVFQYAFSFATLHLRRDPNLASGSSGVIALLGLVLSTLLALAFLPPRSYLARIARRRA